MAEEKMLEFDVSEVVSAEDFAIEHKPEAKKPNNHRKNRIAGVMGALILIFAVIGFITTVTLVGNWLVSVSQNQAEKDKFSEFIYPLVMLDPPAFENVSKLNSSTILSAAVWDLILNADTSKYDRDEFGIITVPETDIEVYVAKLFGEGVTVTHQAIGDVEFSFPYNEEEGVYYIADTPFYSYVPRVTEIQRREDEKIYLRVDYLTPNMYWISGKNSDERVTKVMEYVLEETRTGGYKIISVEAILSGNTASSSDDSASNSLNLQNSSASNNQ